MRRGSKYRSKGSVRCAYSSVRSLDGDWQRRHLSSRWQHSFLPNGPAELKAASNSSQVPGKPAGCGFYAPPRPVVSDRPVFRRQWPLQRPLSPVPRPPSPQPSLAAGLGPSTHFLPELVSHMRASPRSEQDGGAMPGAQPRKEARKVTLCPHGINLLLDGNSLASYLPITPGKERCF